MGGTNKRERWEGSGAASPGAAARKASAELERPGRGDPAVPRPGQADSALCSSPAFCCESEPGVFLQII